MKRRAVHLQRDDAIELDLPRFVHDSHAAAGDLVQQFVVAEAADVRLGKRVDRRRRLWGLRNA